jgi:hypothetical protein
MTTPWVLPYAGDRTEPRTAMRLARTATEHPELNIHKSPSGEWYADVPLSGEGKYAGGGGVLHDRDPAVLLDKLDAHLDDPDTG